MQISKPISVNNPAVSPISVSVTTPPEASGCKLVPMAPKEPGAVNDRLKLKPLAESSALSAVSFYANPENEIKTALKPAKSQGGVTILPDGSFGAPPAPDRLGNFKSHLKYFDTEGLKEMKAAIQEHMAQPNTSVEDQSKLKQMYILTDEALAGRPPVPERKPDSGRDWRKDVCG